MYKYNGFQTLCNLTIALTENKAGLFLHASWDELKQVLKTHNVATASRGLFVSGKRGQGTN